MGGGSSKPYEYDGTCITNRSDNPIWVKVDAERSYIDREMLKRAAALGLMAEGKGGGDLSVEAQSEIQRSFNKITVGFSKIQPHMSVTFDVDVGEKKTVYVSVISFNVKEWTTEIIADAVPKFYEKDFGFREKEGLVLETVPNPKPAN